MSIGCACRTGKVGAQVCLSDGTYGACVCEREMRDADVDTSDVPSLDQIEVEDDAHMSTPLDATPHPDVTDASITADAADSAGVADILDADDSPPSVDGAVDAPSDAPEVTACPIGQHACADICVDDTTPLACGARCERCGAPANAAPTCERGICSFACAAGFHACGGACSDDASVLTCGSSCTPCPSPPANASVTCWLGACGFSCNAGYVLIGGACTPAPPRPIAPLSTSTVTSRRPTFRWSLPVGLEGARVDICTNRAMTTGCLAPIDATGTTATPTSDLPVRVLFWRLRGRIASTTGVSPSPVWQFRVGARSAAVGTSWGTQLDVNGDGLGDTAIAAPDIGTVFVYLGTVSGIAATPTMIALPAGGTAIPVASAGDVNGDGFGDLVIGAAAHDRALVYLGSIDGVSATPSATLLGPSGETGGGASVSSAGDMNGDGYADVAVGRDQVHDSGRVFIYYGSSSGVHVVPDRALRTGFGRDDEGFGFAIAGGGDLNGDGFGDVVALAYRLSSSFVTFACIFPGGGSLTPTASCTQNALVGDRPGSVLSLAGDFNGDGFSDVVVGESVGVGTAKVFGGNSAADLSMQLSAYISPAGNPRRAGASVAVAGDINGDGLSEIVVGATDSSESSASLGRALVFRGGRTGVMSSADWTLEPAGSALPSFGGAVAGSDIDGDGNADVIVGEPGRVSGETGAVHVYLSSAGRLGSLPSATRTFSRSVQFGQAIAE